MKKIASILRLDFLPSSTDTALLLLRLWIGGSMLVLHGWGKLINFKEYSRTFANPLGIGPLPSVSLAVFGEVVCSVLLILGLFTRFAALGGAITMGVAFFIVHKMAFKGPASGELAFIYLAAYLTILVAGSGRYAIEGKSSSPAKKARPSKD
jgi:putative oxidoreductase